ncbi:very-short-patch-repair endonuclease [Ammoniphilus resinae]|uniref:Very-short-patch-repair endonuclease n=2 Tax=Ammoniphilus resinae TaxID=861532 RepID=A0ABS4GNU6_9BACL|nr:very-short-patch-repair endonuclease [Ammoniphilus resinae]
MDKYQYIKSQLAKTNKKNDENYVVTRIWNKIDNLNVKFVTQQYIRREHGYALTDMYFPQLGLHIEINEAHHQKQQKEDKIRESDIVSVTNHEIIVIDVTKGIQHIHQQIDRIVLSIHEKIQQMGSTFIPWDIEKEMSPNTYIQKGYIQVNDNVAFRTTADACNCFGHQYKGFQQAGTKHPYREDVTLWFPKLYPNDGWDNSISTDELIIREKSMNPLEVKKHMEQHIFGPIHKRIVFASVKDNLGKKMYRFKGEFQLDVEQSWTENCLVWKRIADRVQTYMPKPKGL